MADKAVRYALFSQLSLFCFLLICTLLMPHFLFERNEGGVSNYGVHALTVIPYSLAYGLCGLLLVRSALLLPNSVRSYKYIKSSLLLIGFLYVIVLLSTYPYKINHLFNLIHIYLGIILFVIEMAAAVWFAVVARSIRNRLLFSVQLIGFIALLFTLLGFIHILFIAEVLTSLAFGSLLISTLSQLTMFS